jgi:hypothetical protein
VLDAMIRAVTADRRRARIQLTEVVGVSPRIEAERRQVMQRFSALLAHELRSRELVDDDLIDVDLTCVALIGAVNELLVAWINGEVGDDLEAIIRASSELFVRAFLDVALEVETEG